MGVLACNLRPGHFDPSAADTHQSTLHFPPYQKIKKLCISLYPKRGDVVDVCYYVEESK
jgi:hypothetical protein